MQNGPNPWEFVATVAIVLLSTVSSLLGLLRDGHYADPTETLLRIYAQDVVLLVIGVPVLTVGLWFAARGSIRGRIVWLGSLAFMAYMWTHYAFAITYNEFFLGYIALFSLSIFTLVSGTATTDPTRIYESVHDKRSILLSGGFLAVAAVGLTAMWLFDIVPALLAGELPSAIVQLGSEAAYTYVIDLGVLVPCLAISAVWLWQQRPWGYVFTGVLLVFAALVAPTLTAITVVDLQEGIEISLPILIGTIVPPLVGMVFAGIYLRNIGSSAG